MAMMIVLLGDEEDPESGKQSYKVNIPIELEGENLNKYFVDKNGEWRKNGSSVVVARSTTIVRPQ